MRYGLMLKRMFPDVDEQRAGARLEFLIQKHDEHFTEEEFLADAQKSSSPLHKVCEWSNSVAADKYRRRQVRKFLQNLTVVGRGRKPTQAFIYVRHPKHGHKRVILGVRTVASQRDLRNQVIERRVEAGLKQLRHWLVEFGGSEEFRRVRKHTERLRQAIEREMLLSVVPRDRLRLTREARQAKKVKAA